MSACLVYTVRKAVYNNKRKVEGFMTIYRQKRK